MLPSDPLIDEVAGARILNCKVKTLQAWRSRGGGPRYVKVGSLVRYRKSDILEWIERRTVDSTSRTTPDTAA